MSQHVVLVLFARPSNGPTTPVLQHHNLSVGHFQVRCVSESYTVVSVCLLNAIHNSYP